jgi:phage terminase small subunit
MAADLVAKGGPVVMRDGALISNPASREVTRYRFIMRTFGSDFGLSPAARAALSQFVEPTKPGGPGRLLG